MMNFVLFGPPGSGKGTQGKGLAEKYGLTVLSTGEILRNEIAQGTSLGEKAREYMDKGSLVPDEIIIDMMENLILRSSDQKGFLFDGFPRTVEQAKAFDRMLQKHNSSVTGLLELAVPDDELRIRLLKRREIEGRSDDNLETINNRLEVYKTQTEPIIDHYKAQGSHYRIDGVGEITDIAKRLCHVVDGLL